MADETHEWKVILEESGEGAGGGATTTSAQAQGDKASQEMNERERRREPLWSNVGTLVASLASVAGIIAFVFQMVRRSKIFSTFMDNFLTILSAFVDILLIPLWPLFATVLQSLYNLMPVILLMSEAIRTFLRDPWQGMKDLFAAIPNAIQSIGNAIGQFFKDLGLGDLGNMFSGIAGNFAQAFKNLEPAWNNMIDSIHAIWNDKSLSLWDKIEKSAVAVWDFVKVAAGEMWNAVLKSWYDDIVPELSKIWNSSIITSAMDKLGQFGQDVQTAGNQLLAIWGNPNSDLWTKITQTAKLAWDTAGRLIVDVWQQVVAPAISSAWYSFVAEAKATWDNSDIKATLSDMGQFGKTVVTAGDNLMAVWGDPNSTMWAKIVETARIAFDTIGTVVSDVWNNVVAPALELVWNGFVELVLTPTWNAFMKDLGDNFAWFLGTYLPQLAWTFFTGVLPLAAKAAFDAAGLSVAASLDIILVQIAGAITGVISAIAGGIASVISKIPGLGGLADSFNKLAQSVPDTDTKIKELTDGLKQGTQDVQNEFITGVKNLKWPDFDPPGFKNSLAAASTGLTQLGQVADNSLSLMKARVDDYTSGLATGKQALDGNTQALVDAKNGATDFNAVVRESSTDMSTFSSQVVTTSTQLAQLYASTTQQVAAFQQSAQYAQQVQQAQMAQGFEQFGYNPAQAQQAAQQFVQQQQATQTSTSSISGAAAVAQYLASLPPDQAYMAWINSGGGGYQQGTAYVPKDMLAFLHKGEKVVPAAENRGGGADSHNITLNNTNNITVQGGMVGDTPKKIAESIDERIKNTLLRIHR